MVYTALPKCTRGFVTTFGEIVAKNLEAVEIEHRAHTKRVECSTRGLEIGEWVRVHGECRGDAIRALQVQKLEGVDIALFERFRRRAREFFVRYHAALSGPPDLR